MAIKTYDAVILGAGPAGLASAILLAQDGWSVAVIEKSSLPRDKVCGGYFGSENITLWNRLGVAEEITSQGSHLSTVELYAGKTQADILLDTHDCSMGAIGITRNRFDNILLQKATSLHVEIFDQSQAVFESDKTITLQPLRADRKNQKFSLKSHVWIGAIGSRQQKKPHGLFGASAVFKNIPLSRDKVRMYFIDNAHVGINPCEDGLTNVGYAADEKLMKQHQFNLKKVWQLFLKEYPELKEAFHGQGMDHFKGVYLCRPEQRQWFDKETGMLFIGDSVDIINPLLGFGNTIAVESAMLLCKSLLMYQPENVNLTRVADEYKRSWQRKFNMKFSSTWFWGNLSHKYNITQLGLKIFCGQSHWLKHIYAQHHEPKTIVL